MNPGVEAFISPCRRLLSRGRRVSPGAAGPGASTGLGKAARLAERQLSDYSPARLLPLQVE